MEEGFGLGVGGDEVGEAEGGVVGGYFEGGEEVWDGGGVHCCFFDCRESLLSVRRHERGLFLSVVDRSIAGLLPPLNDDQDQVPPANGTRL